MKEHKINRISDGDFMLEERQVLFILPERSKLLSDEEYESARDSFSEFGYDLLYLPRLLQSLPQDLLDYYIPEQNGEDLLSYKNVQNRILGELDLSLTAPMAIMCVDGSIKGLETEEENEDIEGFLRQLVGYLEVKEDSYESLVPPDNSRYFEDIPVCGICPEEDHIVPCGAVPALESKASRPLADNEEYRLEQFIAELSQLNERRLRELGLSEQALRFILGHVTPKLSRLRITRHSKILLEDYSGKEIKLDDKTKALYLLYLRHPEGLAIKDLNDHFNELMDLYQSISGRDDPRAMKQTIENLCDPFQNNANISLSRIKKAFCEALTMQIASNYYVEGERGGTRAIALDRNLVTWETIR